ncbi:MAG: 30S ribosomal protein S17 [bacterium]|nr:30S ribosomal protein S17 [bacterium]
MTKQIKGIIVSNKMMNTVVVEVERFIKHPRYKKIMRRTSNLKAHNENNSLKIGDKVTMVETKPVSRGVNYKII